jgi:hypothetical protein
MTDKWIGHVKSIQNYYKSQGTPLTYNQSMVIAKKTWPQVKAGEKPKMEIEKNIPEHNTKPRQKRVEVVKERERAPSPKRKSTTRQKKEVSRSPPRRRRDDYSSEEDERPSRRRRRDDTSSSSEEEEKPRRRGRPREQSPRRRREKRENSDYEKY